jgi:hypothetical protein
MGLLLLFGPSVGWAKEVKSSRPPVTPLVLSPNPPPPDTFRQKSGFNPSLKVNTDIDYVSSIASSDRVTLGAAAAVNYFFTPQVGAFVEAQIANRGFSVGGLAITAYFLDVPVGIVLSLGHDYFDETARSHLKAGVFFSAALGNFMGPLQTSFSPVSQNFWGVYLAAESLYPMDDLISIGWTVWGKFAVTTALADGTDAKFYNLGIGFIASLF